MALRSSRTNSKTPEKIKEPKRPRYMRSYKYRPGSAFYKVLGRSISGHIARFISLFAIIALGAGVYAGLRTFIPDMYASVDAYYDQTNFMDLQINSTMGLTQDDLDALGDINGIESASGAIRSEMSLASSGISYYTAITSVDRSEISAGGSSYLNQLIVTDGRLPQNAGEIVISHGESPETNQIKLGEKLEIASVTGASILDDVMTVDELTVVGFVHSPLYVSNSLGLSQQTGQTIQRYGFITQDTFKDDDVFTDIFLTVEGARDLTTFTQPYKDLVEETRLAVKASAPEREQARKAEILETAADEIEDAQAELDEKYLEYQQEIADAQLELADAQQELDDATQELEDGQRQYEEGKAELEDALAEVISGEAQLRSGSNELKRQRKLADEEFSRATTQLRSAREELDAAAAELATAKAGLDTMNAAYKELTDSKADLDIGMADVNAAQAELDSNRAQLENAISSTQANISNLNSQISALEQDLSDLQAQDPPPADLDQQASAINSQLTALRSQKSGAEQSLAQYQAQLSALGSAQAEIDSNRQQLESGLAAWQQGMDQFNAGLTAQGFSSIDEARSAYSAGYSEWSAGKEAYDQGFAELQAGRAKADEEFAAAEQEISSNRQRLASARSQIEEGEQELAAALMDLEDGRTQLEEGQIELDEGRAELEKEMADAEREFADAQVDIDEARADLEDLDDPLWYILNRNANAAANVYASNAERIDGILTVFPAFFFLVAALVSLTTMTRMVESERMEIGTLKALGYNNGKIASKYLIFAGGAATLGSIFGIVVGSIVLPYVIWLAYSTLYPDLVFKFTFSAVDCAIAFGLSVGLTLLVTAVASGATLRERPAALMQPRAPKPGKRIILEYITPLWNRMTFSQKLTARNLFRYKSRVIMTVLGVAGCTALLLIGFGIRNYLDNFIPHHFSQIQKYNVGLTLDLSKDEDIRERELESVIADIQATPEITSKMLVTHAPGIAENPTGDPERIPYNVGGDIAQTGGSAAAQMRAARSDASEGTMEGILRDVTMLIPEDEEALGTYYGLTSFDGGAPLSIEPGKVIISQRLSENLMLDVGDTIHLSLEAEDEAAPIEISGVAEFYIGHYVFMSQGTYEDLFAEKPVINSMLAFGPGTSDEMHVVAEYLRDANDRITAITGSADEESGYSDMTSSLGAIVGVVVVVSGALAFIVLYNLTNINIEERRREIATIKVLGFYDLEVDGYIFRETFILSALAIVLGLPLGHVLVNFIMRSAELDNIMFYREITPMSYVIAAVLTIVFTVIVTFALSKRLKQIDMVSSLSANE